MTTTDGRPQFYVDDADVVLRNPRSVRVANADEQEVMPSELRGYRIAVKDLGASHQGSHPPTKSGALSMLVNVVLLTLLIIFGLWLGSALYQYYKNNDWSWNTSASGGGLATAAGLGDIKRRTPASSEALVPRASARGGRDFDRSEINFTGRACRMSDGSDGEVGIEIETNKRYCYIKN